MLNNPVSRTGRHACARDSAGRSCSIRAGMPPVGADRLVVARLGGVVVTWDGQAPPPGPT